MQISIAPLQGDYSGTLPIPARLKSTVFKWAYVCACIYVYSLCIVLSWGYWTWCDAVSFSSNYKTKCSW